MKVTVGVTNSPSLRLGRLGLGLGMGLGLHLGQGIVLLGEQAPLVRVGLGSGL